MPILLNAMPVASIAALIAGSCPGKPASIRTAKLSSHIRVGLMILCTPLYSNGTSRCCMQSMNSPFTPVYFILLVFVLWFIFSGWDTDQYDVQRDNSCWYPQHSTHVLHLVFIRIRSGPMTAKP